MNARLLADLDDIGRCYLLLVVFLGLPAVTYLCGQTWGKRHLAANVHM
jgi:hypothetical protein